MSTSILLDKTPTLRQLLAAAVSTSYVRLYITHAADFVVNPVVFYDGVGFLTFSAIAERDERLTPALVLEEGMFDIPEAITTPINTRDYIYRRIMSDDALWGHVLLTLFTDI